MNASNDQLEILRKIALGLGELRDEVVLVGSGGRDLLHHDIEDIVAIVDGRAELMRELDDDSRELRRFVAEGVSELFRLGIEERVSAHLPGDAASQAREPVVVSTLKRIATFRESGT